ncbi:MAG: hypothetical protein RMK94_17295, partial [Armatimonadota bacterium]|nr:hypothetical protein [Armatimonadota bacterium]
MNLGEIAKYLGISFLVATIITPLVRLIALKFGWSHRADPKKWRRKLNPHTFSIAMGGGFAMLGGFLTLVLLRPEKKIFALSALAFCASILGFYDDLKSPRPFYRLAIQTLFAITTIFVV